MFFDDSMGGLDNDDRAMQFDPSGSDNPAMSMPALPLGMDAFPGSVGVDPVPISLSSSAAFLIF